MPFTGARPNSVTGGDYYLTARSRRYEAIGYSYSRKSSATFRHAKTCLMHYRLDPSHIEHSDEPGTIGRSLSSSRRSLSPASSLPKSKAQMPFSIFRHATERETEKFFRIAPVPVLRQFYVVQPAGTFRVRSLRNAVAVDCHSNCTRELCETFLVREKLSKGRNSPRCRRLKYRPSRSSTSR